MKIAILRNEDVDSSFKWQIACEKINLPYEVIDLTSAGWLMSIKQYPYDFFLLKPPGRLSHYKLMYDERLYFITKILKLQTFPSFEECFIYENKKVLSYFLESNQIPHPETSVFYNKSEARLFCESQAYPFVAKTSIGASGSGVTVIKNKKQAVNYINKAFSSQGIKRRFGPNRVTGSPKMWFLKALSNPGYLLKKMQEYFSIHKHGERDFVIFQKYIPHEYEWRMVKIGESYFGHQKIKQGEKASGTKGIKYVTPPQNLLDFTRNLCERCNFHFMAIDLFEDRTGGYLVNELQTIFGHVQDHILEVDGKRGRYLYTCNDWIFEEGDFCTNESYDLRLDHALTQFRITK